MFNFKILNSRQNKLFFKYCIIGVLSIFIELALRKFFLSFNINFFFTSVLPLSVGIFFAFICNVKFNFNIPRYYYKNSFIYFTIISLSSFTIQFLLSNLHKDIPKSYLENFDSIKKKILPFAKKKKIIFSMHSICDNDNFKIFAILANNCLSTMCITFRSIKNPKKI